ncbi:WAT1-related protein At4g30420-like isoform X2 [Tripterygium wilfordii]|uniref:WAT1-related protein At4g30420-like isoform X2 n=1 Tax=Tripterygium wilfordii TaxID=458696 RepID=UPI0018F8544C|nr:WAT1-related protein At4g30420-like isoform X2 [Tripterygium wilfordii]
MGGLLGDYKYALAMFGLQFASAGLTLLSRAAFVRGTSPRVFIVYRQAIATLFVAPIAYFTRKSSGSSIGLRSFALIFLLSLIGVTINQNIFFEGLFLSSSSMASAMTNLVPAITFVMASIAGLEKVNIRSSRSIAKIVGTVICVGGAVSMAMLKGPKLLNSELPQANSAFGSGGKNWLLGCLCLFGSTCCWSLWLILQVPLSISYPDPVSLSAWMCFLATIQSAVLPFFLEKNADAWILHSKLELISVFFAGVLGSGLSFFVQAWVVSQKGPLFSAMFNPLSTVIVTILATAFLHEEIYTGSLIGALGVVIGLYVVLWGKAKEHVKIEEDADPNLPTVNILTDES